MQIAYVLADSGIRIWGSKGASVHVREFVHALAAEHTVDLFCAALGDGGYDLPVRNFHVVPRPSPLGSSDPELERDRRRLATVDRMRELVDQSCRTTAYDLIYERYSLFSDVGASVADAYGLPFLLEVNAPLINERRRVEALPLALLARRVERSVFRRADGVLAVSEAMASYVLQVGAPRERVQVVPNGVDTSRFHPGVAGEPTRAKLGRLNDLVVGFTGSLKPWHGVNLLLEAFARVAGSNWTLLVVGDGPERASLEAQAEALAIQQSVIFTGAVRHDEIPMFVAAMDIAVAPYRSAATFYFSPLKLYEYLAAGKAVVASDVGQIASVVRHGDNGLLVAPDDARALAHAISRLAADARLRKDLACRAPHGLVTWKETARRVMDIAQQAQKSGAAV